MKVSNRNIVTASVVTVATETVGVGSSSLADRSFTKKRRAKWWSHNLTMAKPENYDKLYESAPLGHYPPLRLREGNGNDSNDIDIDNDQCAGQIIVTPTNDRKRKAGDSPPGPVPENITIENAAIDGHIRECKIFLQDMQTATKVGKKWIQGIEDFLAKIRSCSTNIALEATVISGKYQESKSEVVEANRRLEKCIIAINDKQPKRLYVSAVKGVGQPPLTDEDDYMTVEIPPPNQKGPVKDRLGDFPAIVEPLSKKGNKRKRKIRAPKTNLAKLNAAKLKPVRPAFIIDGNDNSLKMDDIWKVVSKKIPNPKLDGCRRTAEGNFVLTSSDKDTTDAIRSITEGLSIREQGPRKPRLRFKGVPTDYTPDFIASTVINQNCHALVDCTTSDIRPLFKCGRKYDQITDWVIEVSPKAYRALNGKRTYVGMISTFPRPFTTAPHCRRCLRTDHRTADCCAEQSTCYHCAKSGHNRNDCPDKSEKPNCAHCKGHHATMAKECTIWAKVIRKLESITDYGKPDDSQND